MGHRSVSATIERGKRLGLLLAALGFVVLPIAVQATTPTVSNVTGTVATGQTLTVTGANMMDENRTNWEPFFANHSTAYGFEGANPTVDGYGFDADGQGGVAEYQSAAKLSGAKSARFHVQGQHTWPDTEYKAAGLFYPEWSDPVTTTFWSRHYVRSVLNAGNWPSAGKNSWYESTGSPFVFTLQPPSNTTFTWRGDSITSPLPYSGFRYGAWYCVEEKLTGGVNGVYELYVDGELVATTVPTDGGSLNARWYEFGLVNGWDEGSNPNMNVDVYLDNYAISSSRIYPAAKVEIASSSDYAAATKVYQQPLSLADGSIQVTTDLTGLGAGPYYLFVTNNRQERGAAYLLGEADTTSPAAPSGLGVQ